MNKRQYKKSKKKINKVRILDEFFLLDFTPEEYKHYRHHRYKHYKDKISGIIDFSYHPPISKRYSEHFKNILKCTRKYD